MVEMIFESRELDQDGEWQDKTRNISTNEENVKDIIPKKDKVVIHLGNETTMIPFNRVYELKVPLNKETVDKIAQQKA